MPATTIPDSATPPLSTEVERLASPAALAPLWRGREARAEPSFFQSWDWIGTWLACFHAGREMRVVSARRGGALVGLGVATQRGRRAWLHETGEPGPDNLTIERNGFLLERGCDAATPRAMIEALAASARYEEIALSGVGEDYLELAPPRYLALMRQTRPSFALELDAGAPEARLSANTRAQLRRTERDFAALGKLAVDEARDAEEAERFLAGLETLHRRYWEERGRPHAFAHPSFAEFHRRLASSRCGDTVQLLRVSAGENVVGYLYNFALRDRVYAYQSGFDYRLLPRARPGFLCHLLAIRLAAERGARLYDFLAGDNQMKRQLSSREETLHWLAFHRDGPLLRLRQAARATLRRLR